MLAALMFSITFLTTLLFTHAVATAENDRGPEPRTLTITPDESRQLAGFRTP